MLDPLPLIATPWLMVTVLAYLSMQRSPVHQISPIPTTTPPEPSPLPPGAVTAEEAESEMFARFELASEAIARSRAICSQIRAEPKRPDLKFDPDRHSKKVFREIDNQVQPQRPSRAKKSLPRVRRALGAAAQHL